MKWKYDLDKVGKRLREQISFSEDDLNSCLKTLNALELCYQTIQIMLPENKWKEIEEEHCNVKDHIDILNIKDDAARKDRLSEECFDGLNPEMDCVNNDLYIFYNLCDDYRIWIGI